MLWVVVHEFCHAIANPLATKWYQSDAGFRRMSDDSVDLVRYPFYNTGLIMACEYFTRVFQIKYMYENTQSSLASLFDAEINNGFPYIKEVYDFIDGFDSFDELTDYINSHETVFSLLPITPYEVTEINREAVAEFLGFDDFTIGDGYIYNSDGLHVIWCFIDILGNEFDISGLIHNDNGDILQSATGDILYVFLNNAEYIFVDLGSAEHLGWSTQHRMYNVEQVK
jgi:hypothetical protein